MKHISSSRSSPPRSKNNWANEYTAEAEEKDDSALVVHSTYLNLDIEQEWLGDIFLADAEHLKEVNPDAYENEYLGKANGNGGNIFEYIEERTVTDEEISHFDRTIRAMTGDGSRTRMDLLDYIMILPEKQYTSLMKYMRTKNQMNGLQKKLNGVVTMITRLQAIVQNLSQ